MKKYALPALLSVSLLTGCAGPGGSKEHNYAVVRDFGSGKLQVTIVKRQWEGFWGPEGYVGYRDNGYSALLEGPGPVYVNPIFADNPPGPCHGSISLDLEHGAVTVNMRRVLSGPNEPERSRRHPINGTYPIKSVRKVKPPDFNDNQDGASRTNPSK